MDTELRTLLQKYLSGLATLDDLNAWVALNIWESLPDTDNLIDHLAIELSHLDDGQVDEQYLVDQIRAMLGAYRIIIGSPEEDLTQMVSSNQPTLIMPIQTDLVRLSVAFG